MIKYVVVSILCCMCFFWECVPSAYAEMVNCVQVATFSDPNNARGVFQKLDKEFSADVAPALRIEHSNGYYNVLIGMYKDKTEASKLLSVVINNFPEAYVRTSFFDNNRIVRFRENKTTSSIKTSLPEDAQKRAAGAAESDTSDSSENKSASIAEQQQVSVAQAVKPHTNEQQPQSAKAAAEATPPAKPSAVVKEAQGAVSKPLQPSASTAKPQAPVPSGTTATSDKKTGAPHMSAAEARLSGDEYKPFPAEWSRLDAQRSMQRNIALLVAILASILPMLYLWRRNKKNVSIARKRKPAPLEAREPPGLSDSDEAILFLNMGQLREVEGALLSSAPKARSLYVMSSFPGEARTMSAVQLAYALAMNKTARVLLVDGNPAVQALKGVFGISDMRGFSNLLHKEVTLDDCVQITRYPNLYVMPFGSRADDFYMHIRTEAFSDALNTLRDSFDYVIMDGSEGIRTYGAPFMGSQFDGVVLAIECEKTKWEVVQAVIEKLNALDAHIVGAVMTYRQYYIPRFLYGKI